MAKRNIITLSFCFTLCVVFLFAWLKTDAATKKPSHYLMCRNHKIIRTIRVETDSNKGECRTQYTKAGVDRVVGSGQVPESCVKIMNNIRTNLENAHWKCKDVSENLVRFSSSNLEIPE